MAKNLLTVTVKACVDDIKGLIEQLKSLQTYKLFEGDDMMLVDIDDVIEIFTNHIKAERMTGNDLVSRQLVIDALNSRKTAEQCKDGETRNWAVDICIDIVNKLPSAQPDRKLIDDYMLKIKQNISPHTSTDGVVAINYYLEQIYKQIYGEGENQNG